MLTDLHQKLDALFETRRQKLARLEEAEEEFKLLGRAVEGRYATPGMAKCHAEYKDAVPKLQQQIEDIDQALAQTRKQIERERKTAQKAPMTPEDRVIYDRARAYIESAEATTHAAEDLAAKARLTMAHGEALAAAIGSAPASRYWMIGHFRQRLTAGIVRLFERNPEAGGIWGSHGALLELGDSKRNVEIARRGFLEYERNGLRDLLPPNVGAAL